MSLILRRTLAVCTYLAIALAWPLTASASQGGPVDAPSESTTGPRASATTPAPLAPPPIVPLAATATATSEAPRPPRGPAVRERGGRRSRGASAVSGVLFLGLIIGAMGWYVVKRLRR